MQKYDLVTHGSSPRSEGFVRPHFTTRFAAVFLSLDRNLFLYTKPGFFANPPRNVVFLKKLNARDHTICPLPRSSGAALRKPEAVAPDS
jgi:hypothetical protein